jgi:hypothetical protein
MILFQISEIERTQNSLLYKELAVKQSIQLITFYSLYLKYFYTIDTTPKEIYFPSVLYNTLVSKIIFVLQNVIP